MADTLPTTCSSTSIGRTTARCVQPMGPMKSVVFGATGLIGPGMLDSRAIDRAAASLGDVGAAR